MCLLYSMFSMCSAFTPWEGEWGVLLTVYCVWLNIELSINTFKKNTAISIGHMRQMCILCLHAHALSVLDVKAI